MSGTKPPVITVLDYRNVSDQHIRLTVEPVVTERHATKLVARCDNFRVVMPMSGDEARALIAALQSHLDARGGAS